ncbi:YiiX/YebB-like N1pC/P60 family cysteine hydrolase [Paraburkholderia fungorum]
MKKYILDVSLLKFGDIVCTRENTPISKLIRKSLSCEYSHVLLYAADSSCVHADGEGVHSINTQRLLMDHPSDFMVLRLNSLAQAEQRELNEVCQFSRSMIGTEYSKFDAARSGAARKFKRTVNIDSKYQFCSRLIAESYANAGHSFFENPSQCTPADILESTDFFEIKGVVREASTEEIEFALDDSKNKVSKQTIITNKILSESRYRSNKNIQTFGDLLEEVISDENFDVQALEIIEKSGYLTMWADDVVDNPFRYFKTTYKNEIVILSLDDVGIERELKMAQFDAERHNSERLKLVCINNQAPRRTLERIIVLYQVLQSLALQRIELFEWLQSRRSELQS